MNILIVNQSVVDMCASFFTLLTAVVEVDGTRMSRDSSYDQFVCRFWLTRKPLWCMLVTSTYGILLTALDRYIAVVHPIWYHENVRAKLQIWSLVSVIRERNACCAKGMYVAVVWRQILPKNLAFSAQICLQMIQNCWRPHYGSCSHQKGNKETGRRQRKWRNVFFNGFIGADQTLIGGMNPSPNQCVVRSTSRQSIQMAVSEYTLLYFIAA